MQNAKNAVKITWEFYNYCNLHYRFNVYNQTYWMLQMFLFGECCIGLQNLQLYTKCDNGDRVRAGIRLLVFDTSILAETYLDTAEYQTVKEIPLEV